MYGPYLTMTEIKAKYPDEWVFLANPTSTRHEVTGGYIILHSPDRAEYMRLVGECDDPAVKHLASWWTGEIRGVEIFPPDAEPESGAA
ncbi:hypothetical protein GobsT_16270 [Gemmata obscuriglobus]|uniref:Uncharacterized protein n=1 Tax=Gemmata obscuriglobus TaxID=114 RepID=A0A2Z3HAF0_9BACT|nr:hypothetical protein [Gemmata obscuriglobus]AWM39975.1 hypothetical protein C1280_25190 [Gemmata obscuriglobus]QEG26879.1 hypothetical protein GobsT_16270 [Gemmata obscuriglobus]VTS02928.1 unnamed protein product [Gemmata obscuriglobus UQM 2246]